MCSRITPQRYGLSSTPPKVVRHALPHYPDKSNHHVHNTLLLTVNVNTHAPLYHQL